MPYISTASRKRLGNEMSPNPQTCGELNYQFTRYLQDGLIEQWPYRCLMNRYVELKGLSYNTLNDVIGAVTGALMEMRRRDKGHAVSGSTLYSALQEWYAEVAGPYEDEKIAANGDVWNT